MTNLVGKVVEQIQLITGFFLLKIRILIFGASANVQFFFVKWGWRSFTSRYVTNNEVYIFGQCGLGPIDVDRPIYTL